MNLRSLLALSLILPATVTLAADGTFEKTLSLNGAAILSISTGAGYIHVYSGSGNQIHITGHVHSNPGLFGSDADQRVKQIVASPPITQSGNIVTAGPSHADSDLFHNISIDYDVTTPGSTTLTARTGSGSLEIGGILGKVTGESGSGSIKAENISGDAHLTTGSGSIRATNVHGPANLQTGSGQLELSVSAPGDIKAQTGSGSIHIDGISGGLRAGAGSGSIDVGGNPTSEWRVETGSGSIHLRPAPDAHFNFNAETGSGTIHLDHPIVMQGSLNKHHVAGTVNGGGPTLRASTGSGSITVH
ncbi:MAG TPA: DUF4097 family beta strand repeat-containing protein [Acidobacteriaceae bacterium]